MRAPAVALIAVVALSLWACAGTDTAPVPPPLDSEWVLEFLEGEAPPSEPLVTLRVESGRISGNGPVNGWSCSYDGSPLGPFMTTRMAGPPELMRLEARVLDALNGATLELRDGFLYAVGGAGGVARFGRM